MHVTLTIGYEFKKALQCLMKRQEKTCHIGPFKKNCKTQDCIIIYFRYIFIYVHIFGYYSFIYILGIYSYINLCIYLCIYSLNDINQKD